ncbi:unnamed protein product, partial [Polarella glacialis]
RYPWTPRYVLCPSSKSPPRAQLAAPGASLSVFAASVALSPKGAVVRAGLLVE